MKVVMLTFDYAVDRRIILEAESLARSGMQVVIIAAPLSNSVDEPSQGRTSVTIRRIRTDSDPRDADILLKLYFRYVKKVFLKFPSLASKLRAVYFLLKNTFNRKLREDPFLLLPNSWAFYEAAIEEQADVYFAHDLPMLPVACKASEKTGAKLVYDAHEFWTGLSALSRLEVKVYKDIEAGLINKADIVTTVNELIAKEFFTAYGRKPEVLMNCVDWKACPAHTDAIRGKLKLPGRKKIVLYQGALIHHRNLETLVKSSAKFEEEVALVILGYGLLKDKLMGIAKNRDTINKKVFFLDAVSFDELYAFTSSADAGIIPYTGVDINTYFCTPNKLYEFISAGTPIITSDLPAVRQIVEGEKIGVVASMEDENLLAIAVNKFMSDENALQLYRRNLASVHDKYSWERQGAKLLQLIRGITGP